MGQLYALAVSRTVVIYPPPLYMNPAKIVKIFKIKIITWFIFWLHTHNVFLSIEIIIPHKDTSYSGKIHITFKYYTIVSFEKLSPFEKNIRYYITVSHSLNESRPRDNFSGNSPIIFTGRGPFEEWQILRYLPKKTILHQI